MSKGEEMLTEAEQHELHRLTCLAREANGVGPLLLSPELCRTAQEKADDHAALKYWGHVNPHGILHANNILKIPGTTRGGENLHFPRAVYDKPPAVITDRLKDQLFQPEATMKQWILSPPHRAALFHAGYTHVGFGRAYAFDLFGDGMPCCVVVQHFATIKG
jgi:uncharacterized protein YkwD